MFAWIRGSGVVLLLLFLLIVTPSAAEEKFRFPERASEGGELRYINDVPVLKLRGTPEQMGLQHAKILGDSLQPLMDYPRKMINRHGVGLAWALLQNASQRLVNRTEPRHQRELRELIKQLDNKAGPINVANAMLELRRIGGCSAFVVRGDKSATGSLLFGRNLDLPPIGNLDRYNLVTVCHPEGKHAYAAVGYPMILGVISGINDAGLAIATLDVYRSKDGSQYFNPEGVPLTFSFRRILEECTTIEEAHKLLESVERTTWMNLVVCDAKEAIVLEITPKSVISRPADGDSLSCTNHFRTKQLGGPTQCLRYNTLKYTLMTRKEPFKVDDVAEAMHAVNQGAMTLQTMVFEPAALKLHVGFGTAPVTARPLKTLDLAPLLKK